MSFNLEKPVRMISGENTVKNNAHELKKLGGRCLIVTSSSSAKKSGALSDVTEVFNENGIEFSVYDGITENPLTSSCFEAGKAARDFDADFVLGIGGGSALDAAKAVAVFASNPQISSPDLIYAEPVVNKPLPVALIGTTSGTGSEVTGVSVLTNTKGKKKSVKGENYYASIVLADYKYTCSMPYSVTVSTALDALCHAVESLLSQKADESSVSFSKKAITLVWGELVKMKNSYALPSEQVRDRLFDASIYAGLAIEKTGCCFPHTVGYFLTEKHSVPHGKACAVFLPEFVKRGLEYENERASSFLELIGASYEEFEKTVLSLADVNITLDENELESYLPNWEKAANFDKSPGGFNKYDAQKLITDLFKTKNG